MDKKALALERVARAKSSYTVRHVRMESHGSLMVGDARPRAGDVVLASVKEIGHHTRIELANGRRSVLFPGDEVIVAYGNRYAPQQYEAEVPPDLSSCELVAAGGIAARTLCRHARMSGATKLDPLGLITDAAGRVLNLDRWRMAEPADPPKIPPTFAIVGTSMDSGKTTAVAGLIRGLVRSGLRVGAAKVTGTGAGGDLWLMGDAGASAVLDFTHAGYASTYRCTAENVLSIVRTLVGHLAIAGVDVIVLELADGIYQAETAALLCDSAFTSSIDGALFAATDAAGAAFGVANLRSLRITPLAVTGLLTTSPLATREARTALDGMLVLDATELSHGLVADQLLKMIGRDSKVASKAFAKLS